MHDKKNHINKTRNSIQGLRPMSKSLPRGLKTVLKRGGHNYSSIINNWSNLVGKKIASVCYPKSVKTGKELKNGILFLNVGHGDQLLVEYGKREIIDKINVFFGYQFVKEIRIVLIREKIEMKKTNNLNKEKKSKYHKKLENIKDFELKRKLKDLISAYDKKNN
tara:strand:+ start:2018 stop:2509 length:492 start_codon:yes stop_codon:yes gene_type:complete